MGRGFGKGKYKKIIKSIYPLTPEGDVQVHNIGKLVHFCQISPTKLIKVARYVEKKTNSDLTKSKLRSVGASMKIFQDLIKGCRKNLNLFSNNVLRLIKLLLECSFPKLKIIATETFIQFTEVLDENTPYPELEGLITYLIDMCQNQIRDAGIRTRLKQDGLRGIRSYIRVLEMTDELDGFVARHTDADNWDMLLPAILDNLSFYPQEAVDSADKEKGSTGTLDDKERNHTITISDNDTHWSSAITDKDGRERSASVIGDRGDRGGDRGSTRPNAPSLAGPSISSTTSTSISPSPTIPTKHSTINATAVNTPNTTGSVVTTTTTTTTERDIITISSDGVGGGVAGDATDEFHASPRFDRETVHALATEVLRDIFSRANISITSMFKAILRYLDLKSRWVPNTFAVHCMQAIYDCLKVQHGQILITLLLQHAEQPQHSVPVKAQIFLTSVHFFTESMGYFMQIVDTLIKHLVSSVEFAAQDQLVADTDSVHLNFQSHLIACFGLLCNKISQQQKVEAFNAMCARLSQSKHISPSGLSGVVVIFARAILQVIQCFPSFHLDLLIPYLRLFQELSMHNHSEVRVCVQKIFQSILLSGGASQINFAKSTFEVHEILEQVASTVRGTLYFQIKMRVKQAENYVAIFETLKVMLYKGGKYDLVESLPLVFSIQKCATKWKKIPPIRAYTIHTLVAAYLYCVALMFHCKALENYVTQLMQERDKKGQLCTLVTLQQSPNPTLMLLASEYSHAPQKKVPVEYILFDRQMVVDMLCTEGGSSVAEEKRFPKSLMRKYKLQTDTLTLRIESPLINAESVYFPPPSTTTTTVQLPNHEQEGSNSLLVSTADVSLGKHSIIFSPERSNVDEAEKVHKSSKLDIASMKRALVIGIPKIHISGGHYKMKDYNALTNHCLSKITDDQKIFSTVLLTRNEPANNEHFVESQTIFNLDLASVLQCK